MHKKSLFSLFLLGFIVLCFVVPAVSAESILDKLTSKSGTDISTSFGNLVNSNGFVVFLLFVLVAVIVYSIAEFLPFIGQHGWVAGVISVVIAILATFYLNTEEVQSILLSYGALGIVLTVIVPFFAIAAVSKKSYDSGYPFLSKFIWAAFLIVLSIRFFTVDSDKIGNFGYVMYSLFAAAALAMIIMERWIYFKMFKMAMRGEVDQAKRFYIDDLTVKLERAQAELADARTPNAQAAAQRKVADLEAKIARAT